MASNRVPPLGSAAASTSATGVVQLTDSTSSTSTTTAATPNSVKSAYDLANGAIAKTLTTTTGDIIYASGANTPARLGIGSSGNILTVSGGVPSWSAPAAGGAPKNWTLVNAGGTSASGSSVTISGITKDNILIYYSAISGTNGGEYLRFRVNGDTSTSSYIQVGASFNITFGTSGYGGTSGAYDLTTNLGYMELARNYSNNGNGSNVGFIEISGAKSTTSYKKIDIVAHPGYNNDAQGRQTTGFYAVTGTPITSITILMSGGNMDTGIIYVYETD